MTASPPGGAVDIVVNNHNYGRYVAAAVDSALAQTHPVTRVIVVDDGSTDDSREILDAYADRVELVLQANGGQASALNAGLERCEGDLVIFLDADDLLHPEAAARAAAALAADPAAAKVHFRMEVIDAAGRPTGELKPPPRWSLPSGDLRAAELAYPFDLAWLPTSAYAFRRQMLAPILPIPEEAYRLGADWHLIHLSTLLGRVATVTEVSCFYRVHGANNYEPSAAQVDLDRVRAAIRYGHRTAADLLSLAGELGIPHPARILSVADLARRMISLRLEPDRHPVAGDTRLGLLRASLVAVRRRRNASPALRLAFLGWFTAMTVAPKAIARHLALWFLFPERSPMNARFSGTMDRL
ncbi:MAG: glycosyltransferase family 2 protein [Actinobacteria bacterium]|nr:glycosyltransferase family 2 protein [Actinomycetota bacterium]